LIIWQQLLQLTKEQCTLDTLYQVVQNHELETGTDIGDIRQHFARRYA